MVKEDNREQKLKVGGIKISEAKQLAIELRGLRALLQAIIANKNALDVNTAQGQAENARFNYLLINCLVYNDVMNEDGSFKRVYSSLDEFNEEEAEDSIGVVGAEHFSKFYYGLDDNYEHNLPENQFLRKFNFANEKDQLINEDGKTVDFEGNLVDENLRFVDENDNFVNADGEQIDKDGNPTKDRMMQFLDEDGNPAGHYIQGIEEKDEEKPKKTRGRPRKKKQESES